jgi:hypothetical protein
MQIKHLDRKPILGRSGIGSRSFLFGAQVFPNSSKPALAAGFKVRFDLLPIWPND